MINKSPHPPRILVVLVLTIAPIYSHAQDSRGRFSFGIEFGGLSNVRIGYSVFDNLDVSIAAGSAVAAATAEKPDNLGASFQYRFGKDNPTIMIRPSVHALRSSTYDMLAGSDLGVLYDIDKNISTKAFLGLYIGSGSGKGFGEFVPLLGVGVMVHLP